MKLFLASEAKHPTSFEKFKSFVGGIEGKSIAYIPTAANAQGYGSWKSGGSWELASNIEANVTVVELEEFRNRDLNEVLKGIDIIWMAGGACGYLMYWVKRTNLDLILPELLNNGTVYIGSSAGSMVASPTLNLADWYVGEEERGASYLPGLNLVDFDFYPHYNEDVLPEIKSKYKGNKMYLLKNGEAIIVDGKTIEVFGETRII